MPSDRKKKKRPKRKKPNTTWEKDLKKYTPKQIAEFARKFSEGLK